MHYYYVNTVLSLFAVMKVVELERRIQDTQEAAAASLASTKATSAEELAALR